MFGRPHRTCGVCRNVTVVESYSYTVAKMTTAALSFAHHDPARFVMSLHKKAPVTACRSSGLSTPVIQSRGEPMSFIASFISLVVIIGAALVVLTAVIGYGCYSLFREFLAKPPRQLDA